MAYRYRKLPTLSEKEVARFWSKVARAGADDCWPWTGCIVPGPRGGYGQLTVQKDAYRANRYAYLLGKGQDPGDLQVCHSCDNRRCCNPAHLFLGTAAVNCADCKAKGRTLVGPRHYSRRKPECILRGERIGIAKLDADRVRAIREAYATGRWSHLDLAKRFGVSEPTIAGVVNYKTWRHVA